MPISGERITVHKCVHSGQVAVRVRVEAVIPHADPSEPCLAPPAMRFLDEVQRLTNAGDVDALAKIGEVYVRRSA